MEPEFFGGSALPLPGEIQKVQALRKTTVSEGGSLVPSTQKPLSFASAEKGGRSPSRIRLEQGSCEASSCGWRGRRAARQKLATNRRQPQKHRCCWRLDGEDGSRKVCFMVSVGSHSQLFFGQI